MSARAGELHLVLDDCVRNDRELFYQLLNPERFVDFVPLARDRIRSELSKCEALKLDTSGLFQDPVCVDNRIGSTNVTFRDLDFSDCRTLIGQFAPTALLGQCWLRRYWQAANCHTEVAAALFRVYQASLNPNGRRSDVGAYGILMEKVGIDLPPAASHAFCEHDQLSEPAFHHALLGLCLARCGTDFPGELIGFTLADVFGLSGIFAESLVAQFKALAIADAYQACRIRARPKAMPAVSEALRATFRVCPDIEHGKARIEAGFRLYVAADRQFWSSVLASLRIKPSPADRVLALFRKKARFGRGFHKTTRVGELSLDDWFAGGFEDGSAFLDALAHSAWFDVENPDQSSFFTRVTAPGGSMAGVFTASELETIRNWLKARNTAGAGVAPAEACGSIREPESVRPRRFSGTETPLRTSGPGIRELFFRLVNVHQFPQLLPAARNHVAKCLGFTKLALLLTTRAELKCFPFSHAAFENRIESIYRRQIDAYRPLHGTPRLGREVWAWIIMQFAPTVLVDGCWLQNMNDPGIENCPLSDSLWKIYADEIGHGDSRSNHPLIYRHLLKSLSFDLPAIDDAAFVNHKNFIAGSFDIPVYLLAISQFPCTFLPELIGINLAIELSGLGGSYLRLAETLDYWGIDSMIVRVHQSADNMASGHAAIAKTAVGQYLDHVLSLNGERARENHWQRIWLGFVSMRIVPLRFLGNLAWRYLTGRANPGFPI